jgi:hypothetical protein
VTTAMIAIKKKYKAVWKGLTWDEKQKEVSWKK